MLLGLWLFAIKDLAQDLNSSVLNKITMDMYLSRPLGTTEWKPIQSVNDEKSNKMMMEKSCLCHTGTDRPSFISSRMMFLLERKSWRKRYDL